MKECHEKRVHESKKGSFAPLAFTTWGGCGHLSQILIKILATMIATDQEEARSHVINHIRTRVRFALLKCTLIALRGVRGPIAKTEHLSVNDIEHSILSLLKAVMRCPRRIKDL